MNKKISYTKLIILAIVVLGTCAAMSLVPQRKLGVRLYSDIATPATPALEENLEDVPLYGQPNAETCGEAAFLMAWNYAHPGTELVLSDVIATAIQQGWYIPGDPEGVYTSPDHMFDMASSYASQHGMPAPIVGRVNTPQEGMFFLFSQILMGNPVIVDITTVVGDTASAAHFVTVTGVSLIDGEVYYNDPYGYVSPNEHRAEERKIAWSEFWDSWRNNGDDNNEGNGWYMIVK